MKRDHQGDEHGANPSVPATIVRCGLVIVALFGVHELLVWIAARTDLVERLLAPAGAGPAAVLGVVLLVLRVTLLFVVPGAVLLRVLRAALRSRGVC